MLDLELLGPDADGSHVTLADADGRRYRLAVDDALRSVVRPARRPVGVPRPGGPGSAGAVGLRPKEIQSLLRAGVPVEEVAERAGIEVSRAESYAIPVDAERAYVAGRARDLRVGHVSDAPNLGDLVVDRLAQREVDPASIQWDAVRRDTEPWEVVVSFVVAGRPREARWRVDLARHVLTATDDESRWLSETDMSAGSRRHLNAVDAIARGPRRAVPPPPGDTVDAQPQPAAEPEPAAEPRAFTPGAEREELLAQLAASRGTRQELADPEFDEDDPAGDEFDGHDEHPAGRDPWAGEVPGAHPAASHPQDAPDAAVLALPAPTLTEEEAPAAPDGWTADDTADDTSVDTADDSVPGGGGGEDAEALGDDRAGLADTEDPADTEYPVDPVDVDPVDTAAADDTGDRAETVHEAAADHPAGDARQDPAPHATTDRTTHSASSPARGPAEPAGPEDTQATLDVPVPEPATRPAAKPRRRLSRRSVPSWDEIVFGTRSD